MRALKGIAIAAAALAGIAVFVTLGIWQLHRLAWKQALIQRVDERIEAAPVAAPGPAEWPLLSQQAYEYRRVRLRGRYLNDRETLVQAVTKLGAGFWVMTPFEVADGYTVLINRGFVSPGNRIAANRVRGQIEGETTVTGLLRMSEPKGAFLRANDRTNDRWYSRDARAISAARGLASSAPYFIDADAIQAHFPGAPVGGLTVITFPNNHLAYALTWFTLASMLAGGSVIVFMNRRTRPVHAIHDGYKDNRHPSEVTKPNPTSEDVAGSRAPYAPERSSALRDKLRLHATLQGAWPLVGRGGESSLASRPARSDAQA